MDAGAALRHDKFQSCNHVYGSELLVKWVLLKNGHEAGMQSGSYKNEKFYKKRGKATWRSRFI